MEFEADLVFDKAILANVTPLWRSVISCLTLWSVSVTIGDARGL